MRALIQRVSEASVTVDDRTVGAIGPGLLVFLGITHTDGEKETLWMAKKVVELRIFNDAAGKMNRSLLDVGGSVLAVSQFTLYGDARKGRRPSYVHAAPPELAEPLFERFLEALRETGVPVASGEFGAHMKVQLCNDGPVTIWVDSNIPRRG